MKIATKKIISAGNIGANVTGSAVLVDQVYSYAIQAVVTGTAPNGTLKAQFSCDDVPSEADIVSWSDVSGATVSISATGTYGFLVEFAPYKWMRITYTRTSGTGAIDVNYCAKGP
jgi:hypothetical protein